MKKPRQTIDWRGKRFVIEWIKTDSLHEMTPITQVYGVCFNDKEEILIARKVKDKNWIIPGGSPESKETIEETLKREMIEEADIAVKNIKLVGAQKVYLENDPNGYYYQVRCLCQVNEIFPQTPDPDGGEDWKRKFVPKDKITKYVKWGVTGDAMFKDAIQIWNDNFAML